jgi:YfiH family protein
MPDDTLLSSEGGLLVARSSFLAGIPGFTHCLRCKPSEEGEAGGASLRAEPGAVLRIRQVHGARVAAAWRGDPLPPQGTEADAAATDRPGVLLRVLVADCLPVFFLDPEGPSAALAHAGWRGLAAGVVEAAVGALEKRGSRPGRLFAAVGPSIGPCCYEVGEEVVAAVGQGGAAPRGPNGRPRVDLFGAVRARLRALGVPEAQIAPRPPCTSCRADVFHSHRRSGGAPGRNEAFLGILGAFA